MAFDLNSIRRGQEIKPPRLFIYGVEGIGKSMPHVGYAPSPYKCMTFDVNSITA